MYSVSFLSGFGNICVPHSNSRDAAVGLTTQYKVSSENVEREKARGGCMSFQCLPERTTCKVDMNICSNSHKR